MNVPGPSFWDQFVFWLLAAWVTFFAVFTITRKNPVTAVMSLVATFFGLAGIYATLSAHFLAVLQVLVYAGAIMVLFLFVVMLLNAPHEETRHDEQMHRPPRRGAMRLGAVLALALAVELWWALVKGAETGVFGNAAVSSVASIGRMLFTDYSFPFEVTSILILVAMVGAVVLARREPAARGE